MRIRSIKPEFWRSELMSVDSAQWKRLGSATSGAYFLYRFYNQDMRLLYVGITWNPYARWIRHRRTQPWWTGVYLYDMYVCPDESSARQWESWCIHELDPVHNKMQNRRWHRRGEN